MTRRLARAAHLLRRSRRHKPLPLLRTVVNVIHIDPVACARVSLLRLLRFADPRGRYPRACAHMSLPTLPTSGSKSHVRIDATSLRAAQRRGNPVAPPDCFSTLDTKGKGGDG